jgi:hypothetical protein
MSTNSECPLCHTLNLVEESAFGNHIKCSACGRRFYVVAPQLVHLSGGEQDPPVPVRWESGQKSAHKPDPLSMVIGLRRMVYVIIALQLVTLVVLAALAWYLLPQGSLPSP